MNVANEDPEAFIAATITRPMSKVICRTKLARRAMRDTPCILIWHKFTPRRCWSKGGVAIYGYGFNPNSTRGISISGYGVTASDISLVSSGAISANFNITSDATAGNHAVTVTSYGRTSTSLNFFVQVPTSLRRDSLSDIIEITDDDVVDGLGVVIGTDKCGAYRRLVYQLMDQEGQPITAIMEVDELFSN